MKKTIIICLWLFLTLVMSQPNTALAFSYSATVSVDRNLPWRIVGVSCAGWCKYRDMQDKYVLLIMEEDAPGLHSLQCDVMLVHENDNNRIALYKIVVPPFKNIYAEHKRGEKLKVEYPQHSKMPVPFLFK